MKVYVVLDHHDGQHDLYDSVHLTREAAEASLADCSEEYRGSFSIIEEDV